MLNNHPRILMTAVVGLGIAALRADHSKGSFRTADSVHFVSTTLVPLFLTYSFWLTSALISRSSPFYLLNSVSWCDLGRRTKMLMTLVHDSGNSVHFTFTDANQHIESLRLF